MRDDMRYASESGGKPNGEQLVVTFTEPPAIECSSGSSFIQTRPKCGKRVS
jgi:hypothetical protein